jgi:hypothetical protein
MEGPREYQLTMTSSERREEKIIMDLRFTLIFVVVVSPPETSTCESVSEDDHVS